MNTALNRLMSNLCNCKSYIVIHSLGMYRKDLDQNS